MKNREYPENREWKQKAFGMPKLPSGDIGQDKVLYYILKMVKDGKSANTMLNIEGSNSTATLGRMCEWIRPIGLVNKEKQVWTLTELGEMVLERQDSCFSTAVFCSTIVFMGEILFYLQKPKNSQELLKIAEEYHLNWKTNSEIHNRIKWFRDVDMVRFEEYKLVYSLTQKGQEFFKTKQDKNDFLIGNLLPDTTKIKARSHFRDPKYHDRMIEYPETSWFIKKYKHLLSNSSVVGYLFHLYIDRRFFKDYMPRIVEFRNVQDEREERRDMVKNVILKRTGQRLSKQDFFSEKYYYGDYTKMNMYLVNRYQIPTTLDPNISNPGIKEVDYEDVKQLLKELKTYLKVPEDAVKNVRVFDVEDLLFFLENAVNEFKI